MASEGYKGEGVILSGEMAESTTITKGYGITKESGYIALANAGGSDCIGVAIETKTSGAGEHPVISYVLHGVVEIVLHTDPNTDIAVGDSLMISSVDGKFTKDTDTGINTGGLTHDVKKATAHETKDVSADQDLLAFFCP